MYKEKQKEREAKEKQRRTEGQTIRYTIRQRENRGEKERESLDNYRRLCG
jgi:hypothetical protein